MTGAHAGMSGMATGVVTIPSGAENETALEGVAVGTWSMPSVDEAGSGAAGDATEKD